LEPFVRLDAVARDADDRGTRRFEGRDTVSKIDALVRAARRVVLRIEIKDKLAPGQGGQRQAAAGGRGVEVGHFLTDADAQRHLLRSARRLAGKIPPRRETA